MKYGYHIEESSIDVRRFSITTDKPFDATCKDGVESILNEVVSEVFGTSDGTTSKGERDGVKYEVTNDGTEYGDDARVDWYRTDVND